MNLQLPIQMQLSEKRKNYSVFFVSFHESTSNLNIWKKTMMVVANIFLKLQTVKNFVTRLFKKCRFGTRLNSRDMKVFPILAKSP